MRLGFRWRAVTGVLVVGIAVTGCTTSTTADPTSGATSSGPGASVVDTSPVTASSATVPTPTPTVIDPPTSAAPTPPSLDIDAQDLADRAAGEAQWVRFWEVYNAIVRTPAAERTVRLDAVSVDPIRADVLEAARTFESQGLDYYGSVIQHPYWISPIDGQSIAVMRDCQDQSGYGSLYVESGEKRSVGVARNSLQAGFVRGDDGIWRVQNFNHLENVPC